MSSVFWDFFFLFLILSFGPPKLESAVTADFPDESLGLLLTPEIQLIPVKGH